MKVLLLGVQRCLCRVMLRTMRWRRMPRMMTSRWAHCRGHQQPATLSEGPTGQRQLRQNVRYMALFEALSAHCFINPRYLTAPSAKCACPSCASSLC
jgi:hypothetical protein